MSDLLTGDEVDLLTRKAIDSPMEKIIGLFKALGPEGVILLHAIVSKIGWRKIDESETLMGLIRVVADMARSSGDDDIISDLAYKIDKTCKDSGERGGTARQAMEIENLLRNIIASQKGEKYGKARVYTLPPLHGASKKRKNFDPSHRRSEAKPKLPPFSVGGQKSGTSAVPNGQTSSHFFSSKTETSGLPPL